MKKIETVIYVAIWVFLIGIFIYGEFDKRDFKKSEYERGAMFLFEWNHKYNDYPSYWAREHSFRNPNLSVDSIRYLQDSLVKNNPLNLKN